jgi:hypothetical protein
MTESVPKKALMPITERMVARGMEILDDFADSDDPNFTDAQLVIAIYSEMWKCYMAENEALARGKKPKPLISVKNTLIMPTPRGH